MWAWIFLFLFEVLGGLWFWKLWREVKSKETVKNARIVQLELLKNTLEERLEQEEARLQSRQVVVGELNQRLVHMQADLADQNLELLSLRQELAEVKQSERKHKGRAASQATLKGQALEKWAPFLDHPSIDPSWKIENWSFLGSPIDYIVWHHFPSVEENLAEGKVVFLDVKAGKSGLTTKQRRIRDLIQAGRVEWRTVKLE